MFSDIVIPKGSLYLEHRRFEIFQSPAKRESLARLHLQQRRILISESHDSGSRETHAKDAVHLRYGDHLFAPRKGSTRGREGAANTIGPYAAHLDGYIHYAC